MIKQHSKMSSPHMFVSTFKHIYLQESSLLLCQRLQSEEARLLSTLQRDEEDSGRRDCCHSTRPASSYTYKLQKLVCQKLFNQFFVQGYDMTTTVLLGGLKLT